MTPDIKPILEEFACHIHLATLSYMGGPNACQGYKAEKAKNRDKALSDIDAAYRKLYPEIIEEKCSHSDNVTVFHCACCSKLKTAPSHQDKDGNPVWEKTKLPEKFKSNDIAPDLDQVVSILNALIDVVREMKERMK